MFYKGNLDMTTTNKLHVIFGTGPAGSTLAEVLHAQGKQVLCINRSGKADVPPGVSVMAGDVLDVEQVRSLCAKAFYRLNIIKGCSRMLPSERAKYLPIRCWNDLRLSLHTHRASKACP